VTITRGEALYKQLADTLREAIAAGEYPPGSLLPSEAVLGQRYGLSRPTIRNAITALRSEGLVTVQHGRGTVVRGIPARNVRQRRAWPDEPTGEDQTTSAPVLTWGPAPADIAAVLGIEPDEHAVIREWTSTDNGGHVREMHTSYLAAATARGTLLEAHDTGMDAVYAHLNATAGPLRFTERVSARMPIREEATALDLPDGTPILRTLRLTHAEDGHVIEASETRMPADTTELDYDIGPRTTS
jgi:GntR family transcriptional regulator